MNLIELLVVPINDLILESDKPLFLKEKISFEHFHDPRNPEKPQAKKVVCNMPVQKIVIIINLNVAYFVETGNIHLERNDACR